MFHVSSLLLLKPGRLRAAFVPMRHVCNCFTIIFFSHHVQADNRKRYKEEENDHLDDQTAADLAWSKHKLLNESIIVALFQGQFKSTVQCMTCHRKSRTFETFMYLSLPLASTNKCSLQVGVASSWKRTHVEKPRKCDS